MIENQNGFYISKKQASIAATTLVVLGLLFFVAGYFLGKQSVIDGFSQKTSQESFNDHVDYLLTMQSFAAKNGGVMPSMQDKEEEVEKMLQELPDALEEHEVAKKGTTTLAAATTAYAVTTPVIQEATAQLQSVVGKPGKHYATLAGFAKKASANQLVQRLKKRNIDVIIKTKTSKSASGKSLKNWYQVVTKSYETCDDVQQVVNKILKFEKIKSSDVKII
jgi:hypothetical protein